MCLNIHKKFRKKTSHFFVLMQKYFDSYKCELQLYQHMIHCIYRNSGKFRCQKIFVRVKGCED